MSNISDDNAKDRYRLSAEDGQMGNTDRNEMTKQKVNKTLRGHVNVVDQKTKFA